MAGGYAADWWLIRDVIGAITALPSARAAAAAAILDSFGYTQYFPMDIYSTSGQNYYFNNSFCMLPTQNSYFFYFFSELIRLYEKV